MAQTKRNKHNNSDCVVFRVVRTLLILLSISLILRWPSIAVMSHRLSPWRRLVERLIGQLTSRASAPTRLAVPLSGTDGKCAPERNAFIWLSACVHIIYMQTHFSLLLRGSLTLTVFFLSPLCLCPKLRLCFFASLSGICSITFTASKDSISL